MIYINERLNVLYNANVIQMTLQLMFKVTNPYHSVKHHINTIYIS